MMARTQPQHIRVLAVAPSTRGFGFALFEAQRLVDWGVKSVGGNKNAASVAKVEALLLHYQPTTFVLEDSSAQGTRRAPRIQTLTGELVALGENHGLQVRRLTRQQVRRVFFREEQGTKHALAVMLAQWFPEELGLRLPPKRRPWMSEDCRMDIFDAVALALAWSNRKRTSPDSSEQAFGA